MSRPKTQLAFKKDTRDPGFVGLLTRRECQEIADVLKVPQGDNRYHWATPETEDIMIETGYGVSFPIERRPEIEMVLNDLGFIPKSGCKEVA
jgi:hypothetical protein